MKFRPCIDIHAGVVKQIVGSTLSDDKDAAGPVTNFVSKLRSADYAAMYKRDGLTGGHIIMLGASEANEKAAVEALEAFPNGMQIGGGITTANCRYYLDRGASHVIVTSYVFRDGAIDMGRLHELRDAAGKDRLVLDLSCRKKDDGLYYIMTDRWQVFSHVTLSASLLSELADYCDEFLVHAVDVEGKRCGIQEDLVTNLALWSPIPVTYAGGASTLVRGRFSRAECDT
ncbi:phosphoribosylformimino-5-aminoimidazole carboxamide ribotide isomerase, variant [Aphanomyces invadans]|uniref:1-(5-phosphoribosyl)-5-[(5-phosphoribosylamino)methylideneamino]imidazole-4-carboxamideisomerase n=1 Tax=Aphanomyces invadans TaxID=157072 RepID=A0A024TU96_9STRA|nr:phosphoribosylformimino-5-aminoimidazole carboxamide ribotide isomerase, variant [Aphanomyces invadans]ETV97564.1 phosphoribosylformimino-5-aminoimidazole carboxamide ribotide isomerase, variant [Aphanomyces invadans]|eukprot:XP_008873773.1 phosphoribosylformimino-5-aminoimidazole carboxamide ribotide isomerase, variant [Aphanomyces invadans]